MNNDLTVRMLTKNDIAEHEKLAALAFIGEAESDAEALPCPTMPGVFDGGRLIADMEVYDRKCFFGGQKLSCAAVGGVASRPEDRNKGAVRRLFAELFGGKLFADRHFDICLLYPFSTGFYKKLGFGSVGELITLTVPFSELFHIPKNSAVKLAGKEDEAALIALYNEAAKQYALCFERETAEEFLTEPYTTKQYTYIARDENGNDTAYAAFFPDREKRQLSVRELMFTGRKPLEEIIGFLRSFEGNFDRIVFESLPFDSPVTFLANDLKKTTRTVHDAAMARILDLESVLKKAVPREGSGRFTVRLEDGTEKNHGTFSVAFSDGKAEVRRTEDEPEIILSAPAAARLLLYGITDPAELSYMDGVTIRSSNKDFMKYVRRRTVFFCDGF